MSNLTDMVGTVVVLGVADSIINKRRRPARSKSAKSEYKLYSRYPTKAKASAVAMARRGKGYLASVRKENKGYSVWVRR